MSAQYISKRGRSKLFGLLPPESDERLIKVGLTVLKEKQYKCL